MPNAARTRGRYLSQSQAALVLLLPFLAVYALFLVYPFFRGVWISLHDWNLMAVAMNPDAKEFVGTRNFERVMWGANIVWGPFASPFLQIAGALGLFAPVFLHRAGRLSRATAIALGVAAVLLIVIPGFHPGEGGRWYDRRSGRPWATRFFSWLSPCRVSQSPPCSSPQLSAARHAPWRCSGHCSFSARSCR